MLVADALQRLELICDAYLSVSDARYRWLRRRSSNAAPRSAARSSTRVRGNYDRLRTVAGDHPSVEVLHADGGWSAVLRVPSRTSEEEIVLDLLDRDGVVVHPGFFFDFAHEAFLVVSLLPPPQLFEDGVHRVLARVR